MVTKVSMGRRANRVVQFSVFTPNRLGRLHELVGALGAQNVHVLALTVPTTGNVTPSRRCMVKVLATP